MYATELSRYMHLNPVRAGIVEKPDAYKWSSFRFYVIENEAPEWLARDLILGYFGKKLSVAQKNYKDFVHSLIEQKYKSPLWDVAHSVILGSKDFVFHIKQKFLGKMEPDRNVPALREFVDRPDIEKISEVVNSLMQPGDKSARNVKIHLSHKLTGKKLKEIGPYFGIGESGVSQTSRRIKNRLKRDRELAKTIVQIEKMLRL